MSSPGSRDGAFDFVKGILVLLMVVYHVMNIMSTATFEDFRYIRFISGSFIFISGFILGRFSQQGIARDPLAASWRLIVRGLRLVAIFTMLNMLIYSLGVGNADKLQGGQGNFWSHAGSIYLRGDWKITSFFILLPIGYLLALAPALLVVGSLGQRKIALPMLVGFVTLAAIPSVTDQSSVIEFLLVGACGLSAGLLALSSWKLTGPLRFGAVPALAALAVSVWFAGRFCENIATYTIGLGLIVKFLYDLAPADPTRSMHARLIVQLGRYSLVSYIGQIILIHALAHFVTRQRSPLGLGTAVSCLLIGALLLASCSALDRLRARSTLIDRGYRLIFS